MLDLRTRTAFVIDTLGGNRVAADLLNVAPSQTSRWASGQSTPKPEQARALIDLDHVLALALQIWVPEAARDWLTSANGHLDGARPIDVLRTRGANDVVDALRATAAGAYA